MKQNKTMLTDMYQLTMNAGYMDNNKQEKATFELFIRSLPKDWGFYIANGIEEAIDYITNIKFNESDIEFLRAQGKFNEEYLNSLKNFKFNGTVHAVKEGTPITPNTPILRITSSRDEAQFVETTLLNIVNFQTMIASKASRINYAANGANVIDMGLRRAQGEDAALKGARASHIAGAVATSNILAGKQYGIPVSGTMAHSFVMSFENEIEAFRAYTNTFTSNATLLIDTYNTAQGARNASIVAKELEAKGSKLGAVRIDSGDLTASTKEVRSILNEAGLNYVKIVVSNDLNEYKIEELVKNNAPIDVYGVGTEMITAKPVAAISGVYKIVQDTAGPKIKLSASKKTYPGAKQVYRISDEEGNYLHDVLALDNEDINGTPLLEKVIENGERISPRRTLKEIKQYSLDCIAKLPKDVRALRASQYKLKTSQKLDALVDDLTSKYNKKEE